MNKPNLNPLWLHFFHGASAGIALAWLSGMAAFGSPEPVGLWNFDDSAALLKATIGRDLQLRGDQLAIAGVSQGDGAVRIGVGSHYVCTHDIAPNASGTQVNRYSFLFDFRIPQIGPWYCFFQTDAANQNDGDCFIRASDGAIGVAQTGYSAVRSQVGVWQRLIVAVDNSEGVYRIYLNGDLILNGAAQAVDGRFALGPTVLLLADDDGEDAPIDITRLGIYDVCLSASDAVELGGADPGEAANHAPTPVVPAVGPAQAQTGHPAEYRLTATDPDLDLVQIRVDWSDGGDLSEWSSLVPSGQAITFSHTFTQPGVFRLRASARDQRGKTGQWTDLQDVQVAGSTVVQLLTPPYLQNVKPDGITIMWELDLPVDAEVEYGPGPTYGSRAACTRTPSGANTQIYKCVLTGLDPGTTYHYRTWAGGHEGQSGLFTTAPTGSPNFAFSVWSDSQGSNHGTYDADPLEPTKSFLRHMATNGVAFAVASGDMAENGGSYSDTRQYYLDRVARLLGSTVPWYVGWGNHDGGPDTVIRKFADFPSKNRPGYTPGYGSYSFDYAGCHFIAIDYAASTSDILTWLEADLQSEANTNAKFTFLFIHVPPYCELWLDGDSFLRSELVPLLENYGVDVCFSGHTHEYSRGYLNGVYYCVTGGGSWLDFPEMLITDWEHMTVGGYHSIPGVERLRPDGGGGLVNEYVRVEITGNSFTASMIGFTPDGKEIGVLDRFSSSTTPTGHAPSAPQVTGPESVDVLASDALVLHCSAFADQDPGDALLQTVWRLSRTADVTAANGVVWEGTTGPDILSCTIATRDLWPGQTLYASAKHVASDRQASPFSTPLAIRLTPNPIYFEDFEKVQEFSLPQGWTAADHTSVDIDVLDPDDPQSNTYHTWTVVSADRLARVMGGNRVNAPLAVQGNSVYAESDHRTGVQLQYLTTPDFDLGGATNVLLLFRSNYLQNQDSLGALEYSIDGGAAWRPVVYLLDASDVVLLAGGQTIDAAGTFNRVDPDGVPTATGTSATGGTYGEHILSRPFESLGTFIDARVNDDPTESKRVERFRLPGADAQSRARFRFTLVGTGSWFWGIDDFALYGTTAAQEPLRMTRVARAEGVIDLEWTGPAGPYQIQSRPRLGDGAWENLGEPLGSAQRSVRLPVTGTSGFYRIRLAR